MLIKNILKIFILIILTYYVVTYFAFYNPNQLISADVKPMPPPYPSQSFDNIFWFIQISDIHISKFRDMQRGPDLEQFCTTTLDIINPELILVTGDLTDAKDKNFHTSKQFQSEWVFYRNILKETNVSEKYVWIDVRGNHDAFDIMSHNSPENFYRMYSVDKGKRSQPSWTLVKPFGNYTFIHVDATLTPGPKRPFNFIGYLSQEKLDFLYQEGSKASRSNFTFWYGHYPSSVINYGSDFCLRKIIGKFGDVYLNGHLHDLLGIAPTLYGLHPTGFLELELKDWMVNRAYRIIAIDHDLLSFTDVIHHDWPVVLITNPKPATFMIPKHEPIARMRHSTHVRFLVFSPSLIEDVSVSIDGVFLDSPQNVEGPLWVSRWNASLYSKGTHRLLVTVKDGSGRKKSVVSEFSLDKQWHSTFSLAGMLLILTDLCEFIYLTFLCLATVTLALLLISKIYGSRIDSSLFKLDLLLSDNVAFFLIVLFLLNLLIGPLFIGEILSNLLGVCFSYGLLVDGELVRETLIYTMCISLLLFSYIPTLIYLSHCSDLRWARQCSFKHSLKFTRRNIMANLLFLLHIYYQCHNLKNLSLAYSWVAAAFSPSCLWWLVTTIYLAKRTWTRPVSTFNRSVSR